MGCVYSVECCVSHTVVLVRMAGRDHLSTLVSLIADHNLEEFTAMLHEFCWKTDDMSLCLDLCIAKRLWGFTEALIDEGVRPSKQSYEYLLSATSEDEVIFTQIVDKIQSHGVNIAFECRYLLFLAALNGQEVVAEYLLNKGCDANMYFSFQPYFYCRGTALHAAIISGQSDTALMFLKHLATDLNKVTGQDMNIIHLACLHCQHKFLEEALLQAGHMMEKPSSLGATPLQDATNHGCLTCVKILLAHGADVNARNRSKAGTFNCTPLMLAVSAAVSAEKKDIVELLLQHPDCDVDARDSMSGMTALHRAADIGDMLLVTLLIKHGASPNPIDLDLASPLSLAVNECHMQVALVLLPFIGDPDPRGHIITMAFLRELWELLSPLICAGARVKSEFYMLTDFDGFRSKDRDDIFHIIRKPLSLKCISKIAIRKTLGTIKMDKTDKLGLPHELRSYVHQCYI